jgi:type VI secretion system protein ImpJ
MSGTSLKQLQQVVWSKGTFLTPQHLQLQDRFVDDNLQFQLEAVSYRFWGFAGLRIDEAKLVQGEFVLSEASGVTPDGLLFDFPLSDAAPASRSIGQYFSEQNKTLGVYLAVPEWKDAGVNVSSQPGTKTRFHSEVRMIRDENSGLLEKPIQLARKNLRLLLEGENLEGNTVMQVAVAEKKADGTHRLSPSFVPPMIDIHGSSVLVGIVRSLVETLSARSSLLAGTRRQKNQSLADFTASDVANFWLLYTINSNLPVFRHLFHRTRVHPEQLYTAMLSLAGALTTFSTTIHTRDLPDYKHDDLGTCFLNLEQKLRILLETVVPTNFVALPLKMVRPSIYATAIDDDKYLRNTRLYLAVSAEMKDAELIAKVPQLMKVAGAGQLEDIVRRAMAGLKLMPVAAPPPEIPVKLKYKYFSLDATGAVYEGIQRARNLGVYAPAEFPGVQLELIVLMPHRGAS